MTTLIDITGDWSIEDGPSREVLFDALRLFNEQRRVEFTVLGPDPFNRPGLRGTPYTLVTQVNGIQAEDGSGQNWILTVYFLGVPKQLQPTHLGPYTVYFNDQRRKGHVLDATPLDEKLHIRGDEVWRGSQKIGEIPRHLMAD